MTELEFELEFKKRKLQKRKQRRMELLIIGAHLGVVLGCLASAWYTADPCAPLTGMEICFCTRDGSFGSRIMEMWWSSTGRIWNGTL